MRFVSILAFLLIFSAVRGAYVLPPSPPGAVVIDWDGMDEFDHDGQETFSALGDIVDVRLKVLCNEEDGYSIFIHSDNARTRTKGELVSATGRIGYGVTMNTSGIQNANIRRRRLNLRNENAHSIKVKFNRSGNVLPLNGNTQANEIQLLIQLDPFLGVLYPTGNYADVITATAILN